MYPPITRHVTGRTIVDHLVTMNMVVGVWSMAVVVLASTVRLGKGVGSSNQEQS